MILLDSRDYYKVIKPLKSLTINNLFAQSVVEMIIPGTVYVDDRDSPKTFYIIHPYGLSLLFGETENEGFNTSFCNYCLNLGPVKNKQEWLQVFPDKWNQILSNRLAPQIVIAEEVYEQKETKIIELHTRVNFNFNFEKYQLFKNNSSEKDFKVVRTNERMFNEVTGGVVPSKFWKTANDFYQNSVGFSLIYKGKVACTSYAAFIHDNKLEIGLETVAEYRGMGFAQLTCSSLIDYCIENDYEPVWACRLGNIGSYKLAQKLGFEPTLKLPFYKLSK